MFWCNYTVSFQTTTRLASSQERSAFLLVWLQLGIGPTLHVMFVFCVQTLNSWSLPRPPPHPSPMPLTASPSWPYYPDEMRRAMLYEAQFWPDEACSCLDMELLSFG